MGGKVCQIGENLQHKHVYQHSYSLQLSGGVHAVGKNFGQLTEVMTSSSTSISGSAQSTATLCPHSWMRPDMSFFLAMAAARWLSYSMKANPLFLVLSLAEGYTMTSFTLSVTCE